ncbi:MAG: hypothetical protein COU11_02840 [Candidatus Harrisonbacteria bacterium CG10_big_fil_rev_8_21_14_0_10_49_15]|uniref:Uncharacterized protein n=1 Tax=Candidatus Harrisonbacteria bacterium CG10_big_fil_rev_8_21_14_0_10_49_15 TaxID=1974587 RepID=A0A2H0UKJ6_9BACT|nr:MAG: hypothetical protein COU11_02840 [Candidatus Harrisonbacteria bacterium CG10_big_fil_rev_8_21_14_0_10_49_15]
MSTEMQVKKLNAEVKKLRKEVAEFRQLFFAVPEDNEGEYKEVFIKKITKRASSGNPLKQFSSKKDFLQHVRKAG